MTRQYNRVKPLKEKPVKIKTPKYNIKYINNEEEVLFDKDYFFIKDSVEDLKKICPMISLRRLRLINETGCNDSLKKYIIITNYNKVDTTCV